MKIAVAYDNGSGNVFQHFGKSENFKVYEVEDSKVVNSEVIGTDGLSHCTLASMLAEKLVDVLICWVIAFVLGFIIGLFIPPLVPYAGIIDIIMGIIAFGMGIYISIFKTSVICIELENQIVDMLINNYMQYLDSQKIVIQMLGLL